MLGTARVARTMMRVTLGPISGGGGHTDAALFGEDVDASTPVLGIESFISSGRADEFLSIVFPGASAQTDRCDGEDGTDADVDADVDSASSATRPFTRYYTVRRWDPATCTMEVDFVLHGHGPAAAWAAAARIGDVIMVGSPRGHYAPPTGTSWIALVGDATALPAIARILEEHADHPDAPPVVAVLDLAEPDAPPLALRPTDRVVWAAGDEPLDLLAEVRRLTARAERGYVWFSGEAGEMRAVRRHLRHELRWPTSDWMTMGYWRRDAERWRRRFDALGPAISEELDAVYATGDDDETMRDRAEAIFAAHGL